MSKEISSVRECLFIKNKNSIKTDKRYNIKSSVVNHLMCIHEDLLINRVLQKFGSKNVHALCFDGFIYNKFDSSMNISELDKLTEDYGIMWDIKPFNNNIQIPDDFTKEDSYEDIKKEFEKTHAICINPICFIKKTPYENLLMNKSDFADAIAPWKTIKEGDKKPVFDLPRWLEDPLRRAYNKMEFVPYLDVDSSAPDIYNTFRPFLSSYIQKDDRHTKVSAFMEHLTTNMCNNDDKAASWLFNLFAWRFQNPDQLPKCGVVLKGLQGAGKDRTIDILHLLMGKENDYIHRTSEIKELYGDFNSALKNKLIVQCNEVEGKTGCEYKEKLKDTITRNQNTINEKNMKPYKLKNLSLVIVCSNNLTPIQIPFDDRRWVVFQTGRQNIGNRSYWTSFSNLIDDPAWVNSLYSEFLDTDLKNWEPDNLFLQPRTEAYVCAQEDNIPLVYKYLHEVKWDSFLVVNGKYMVPLRTLISNINAWLYDQGTNNRQITDPKLLNKLLREITGIQTGVRLRNNGIQKRYIVFDKEAVVHDLTSRVFKNIKKQPIVDIDLPCLTTDDEMKSKNNSCLD
jgi:hypothetical protein